jgi:hypothetical protein
MNRSLVVCILSFLAFSIWGCGSKPITFEAAPGVVVQISGLNFQKSHGKVFGYVQIVNQSQSFFKVCNKELCLISGKDTVRAFMKLPGEWEIDKGLVNIMRGKDLTYDAYWPIKDCNIADIKFAYFQVLSRDEENQ